MGRSPFDALLEDLENDASRLEWIAGDNNAIGAWLEAHRAKLGLLRGQGEEPTWPAPAIPRFPGIIGHSAALVELLGVVERIAPTDAPVLIGGETGTGKQLIARNIHARSRRADRAFVAVNCGALPSELIESELFGHDRGAFTGAMSLRVGRLEAADGGTLFFDEIGDLTPEAQTKLLRVLADGSFERVGTSQTRRADVRLVAATHRNLSDDVALARFRQDLFYRLNVIRLQVPALRERQADIALLAAHFLEVFGRAYARSVMRIHPAAMAALESYAWPGNVRELANVVERAVILATGLELGPELLGLGHESQPPPSEQGQDMKSALRAFKRRFVERAIATNAGSAVEAARSLGVHPKYLYELLRELDLPPPSGAPASANGKEDPTPTPASRNS